MERRRSSAPPPGGQDRRRGDRRGGQAAVLDHRRATDHRLDAVGSAGLLQRRSFQQALGRARQAPDRVVSAEQAGPAVADLVPAEPVELVRCPLCDVLQDRMWLFRHVAADHA